MKNLKTVSVLIVLLLCGQFISAQTADEIIAKYVNAIGGKDVLSKVTSVYTESNMELMGMQIIIKSTTLNGVGLKQEMDVMGSTMTTCYTDKGGWSINPMTGATTAEDMPETQYNAGKNQIVVGAPFINYAENGYKAEFLGTDTLSKGAFKIKLTAPDNKTALYFFDPVTFYLVKSVQEVDMQGQMVENTTTFSDYKQADSYTLPHKMNSDMGGQMEIAIMVTKVELNKPVDAAIFAKP